VGQDPTRIFISQLKLKRMLTKQLREMERQAQVIEQHQNLLKLNDLMCCDGLYYIGDIVDVDGNGWVEKDVALDLLYNLNIDWMS